MSRSFRGFAWNSLTRFLARAYTWTGIQTFSSLVATTADINGGTIDSTSIGATTASTVQGLVEEDTFITTGSITANQCAGKIINNLGQTADCIAGLPAAAAGYSITFLLVTTVAKYYHIDAAAGDLIILDGVAGSDSGYVGVVSAAYGNEIQLHTVQTAAGAYDWVALTVAGPWVAG